MSEAFCTPGSAKDFNCVSCTQCKENKEKMNAVLEMAPRKVVEVVDGVTYKKCERSECVEGYVFAGSQKGGCKMNNNGRKGGDDGNAEVNLHVNCYESKLNETEEKAINERRDPNYVEDYDEYCRWLKYCEEMECIVGR